MTVHGPIRWPHRPFALSPIGRVLRVGELRAVGTAWEIADRNSDVAPRLRSSSASDGQHPVTVKLGGKTGITQAACDLERNISLAGEPVRRAGIVK